jgi:hypothetical protein
MMMKKNISGKAGRKTDPLAARKQVAFRNLTVKQMAFQELRDISGGNPWAWMVGGYVFGKVMDKIFEECFVAGTAVTMSDGSRKNIEDVKVGEEVLSCDVHTNRFEPKKVSNIYTQVHDLKEGDITVRVTFSNGVVTHNTIANPFWSRDKGFVAVDEKRCNRIHPWVQESNRVSQDTRILALPTELRETATAVATEPRDVQALNVGDILYWYNAVDSRLEEVSVESVEHVMEPGIRTYDIEVPDNHTFFANGILTHNSGGSAGGGGYGMGICFTGDMEVEMANGAKRRISDIKKGDLVRTTDVFGRTTTTESVIGIHRGHSDLFLNINGNLELTPNHVVYVENKGEWLKAETLSLGDRLLDAMGSEVEVHRIETMDGLRPRYNLTLPKEGNLNLLVSGLLVSSSMASLAEKVVKKQILRGQLLSKAELQGVVGGT